MKQHGFLHTLRSLYAGQSLARIRMNEVLRKQTLTGRVLDVGGGRYPDYFMYLMRQPGTTIETVDGALTRIDFEVDSLPYDDHSFDTVLLCNVLEHVYRHQHLLKEIHRVLKSGGVLIGFVPFWTGYHPDPHDYFRYTAEALQRMFVEVGFTDIDIRRIGGGPFLANFNTIVLSFPRLTRPLLYCVYAILDAFFVRMRPRSIGRNPLGYQFSAHA